MGVRWIGWLIEGRTFDDLLAVQKGIDRALRRISEIDTQKYFQ